MIYVEAEDPKHRFAAADLDLLACLAVLAAHSVEHSRTHNKWYRAVVHTALDGIFTCDERGTICSANPASERMFGYGRGQLSGLCVSALFDGGGTTSQMDWDVPFHCKQLAEPGRPRGEILGRRKDGSSFPMEFSIGEFVLDNQQHCTLTCHDVTAWKQAEDQLRELNASLEQHVAERTGHVQLLQGVAVIANGAESVPDALRHTSRPIRIGNATADAARRLLGR